LGRVTELHRLTGGGKEVESVFVLFWNLVIPGVGAGAGAAARVVVVGIGLGSALRFQLRSFRFGSPVPAGAGGGAGWFVGGFEVLGHVVADGDGEGMLLKTTARLEFETGVVGVEGNTFELALLVAELGVCGVEEVVDELEAEEVDLFVRLSLQAVVSGAQVILESYFSLKFSSLLLSSSKTDFLAMRVFAMSEVWRRSSSKSRGRGRVNQGLSE
jgi:hypothetical protein